MMRFGLKVGQRGLEKSTLSSANVQGIYRYDPVMCNSIAGSFLFLGNSCNINDIFLRIMIDILRII